MSSSSAPYATQHDLPNFEHRAADVRAPWCKEQPAVKNVRGQVPVPYVTCNSKNAPYATFDNVPKPSGAASGSRVPLDRRHSAPYGTSSDIILPRTQANLGKVHQAPWDRGERELALRRSQGIVSKVLQAPWDRTDVHHKVQTRCLRVGDGAQSPSPTAPYATDSKRG